jgi:hypothetical protein
MFIVDTSDDRRPTKPNYPESRSNFCFSHIFSVGESRRIEATIFPAKIRPPLLYRKRPEQPHHRRLYRLPSTKNCLNYIRRQQRQPQEATDDR